MLNKDFHFVLAHHFVMKNKCNIYINENLCSLFVSQGKGHLQRLSYHTPSPPVSPRLPSVADVVIEESGDEDRADSFPEISEHQQAAMQQEERVLTEQIESLQKEK